MYVLCKNYKTYFIFVCFFMKSYFVKNYQTCFWCFICVVVVWNHVFFCEKKTLKLVVSDAYFWFYVKKTIKHSFDVYGSLSFYEIMCVKSYKTYWCCYSPCRFMKSYVYGKKTIKHVLVIWVSVIVYEVIFFREKQL